MYSKLYYGRLGTFHEHKNEEARIINNGNVLYIEFSMPDDKNGLGRGFLFFFFVFGGKWKFI